MSVNISDYSIHLRNGIKMDRAYLVPLRFQIRSVHFNTIPYTYAMVLKWTERIWNLRGTRIQTGKCYIYIKMLWKFLSWQSIDARL